MIEEARMPELLIVAFGSGRGLVLALAAGRPPAARVLIAAGRRHRHLGAAAGATGPAAPGAFVSAAVSCRPSGAPAVRAGGAVANGIWASASGARGAPSHVRYEQAARRGSPALRCRSSAPFGVFGLQDAYSFLIAWELMSFGGAVMILSERLSAQVGRCPLSCWRCWRSVPSPLLLALLLLARVRPTAAQFGGLHRRPQRLTPALRVRGGLLALLGFGAKLGLLPFYEWFPGAYATGSGASGAIMSGVVLNAAFFALSRGLIDWLPASANGCSGSG